MSNEKKDNISSEQILNDIKKNNSQNTVFKQEENITESVSEDEIKNKKILNDISDKDFDHIDILNLQSELLDIKNKYRELQLRTQAEIENIRRRTSLDIEKAHKFALENFAIELLPVIDNLERAMHLEDKSKKKLDAIFEGVELTLKSLLNTMYKFGIRVVDEINIPFNPELHQAMSLIESKEIEENYVLTIMQRGYILNGRLLRPAMVAVSTKEKNKHNAT